MADRFPRGPTSSEAAEREARRATADLFAGIAGRRRRLRRTQRSRQILIDLVVAMATYTGVTVAVIIGLVCGIRAAVDLLAG